MPRLKFSDIYTRVESISNVTGERALIKDAIQWGIDELTSHDLPYLMSEGIITTVAPYTTGTVAATNGSADVVGTGTTWTSSMVGRKIRIDSEVASYRIKTVTDTENIVLDTIFTGTTTAEGSYSIYKNEYKLLADVDIYKVLRQVKNGISLGSEDAGSFDIYNPSPTSEGSPYKEVLVGTRLDTYTTGTIAGMVSQKTLTGTTTEWLSVEGLSKGSRITIGNNVYTVKSVDSDTQITIYEAIVATVAGSSYTVHLDNLIIQLSHIPSSAENIYYRYQRIPYPVINDYDIPDVPEKYHMSLVTAGLAWVLQGKDKEEATKQLALFEAGKKQMWSRMGHISTSRVYSRKSQDMVCGNRFQMSFPSNMGIPISW